MDILVGMTGLAEWFSFMRGNVLVMTICECVWRSTIDIIWPFLSLYVLELGGSYETIGFIMTVGSLASMIFYPLGGYIADYQGRIKLIGYMTFAYGAAFLIPAFTSTWQWLVVGMFVQSLATFYFPARQALIADSIPPERRGIVSASKADIVIPGNSSNWACYGIEACLAKILNKPEVMHDEYTHNRMLLNCANVGIPDGATAMYTPTTDGSSHEACIYTVGQLRQTVEMSFVELVRESR